MLQVLLDTDVILDVLLKREEYYALSVSVLNLCSDHLIKGWITVDSYISICSVLKQKNLNHLSKSLLDNELSFLSIIPIRHQTILDAHKLALTNFNDCLKIISAKDLNIDYIITRNISAYKMFEFRVKLPSDFIKEYTGNTLYQDDKKYVFVDLKAQYHQIYNQIDNQLGKVLNETAFVKGKYVVEFEKNFANYCKAKHCVGVGNGTDALFIALKSLNISLGDEVIVPANSFIATSEAVTMAGARVVFVDCDPDTYNIDVNLIEAKINHKTKAIIPVHLYGQPANMPDIYRIAKKNNLKIIQDCAQAHGATYDGNPLIYYGDILCFSFYPGKNLGAYGDAGAVVTNNDVIANRAFMFANHGRIDKYNHEFEGVNSRMDGIQGAVLNIKLNYIDQWNENRIKKALLYNELLKEVNSITRPYSLPNVKHVYHLFVIRLKQRDELRAHLNNNNISTGIHYPIALPNLKAYAYLDHKPSDFPVASQYQNEILSLPLYPEISDEVIRSISKTIADFI